MFEYDECKRYTAEEALRHPWFNDLNKDQYAPINS